MSTTPEHSETLRIRENRRYRVEKAIFEGRTVCVKSVVDETLRPRLEAEVRGMAGMAQLDSGHRFYQIPDFIKQTDTSVITEWIDAPPMSDDFREDRASLVTARLRYLMELYAFIDVASSETTVGKTVYDKDGNRPLQILGRIKDRGAEQYFEPGHLDAVAAYAGLVLPITKTHYTNGDLQPGNLLINTKLHGCPYQIDFEACSSDWPRHYNIVNFIFNYSATYPWLQAQLQRMFDDYCARRQLDSREHTDAFNVSAAMRSLQMIDELLTDSGSLEQHRIDFIELSMERIVQGQLFLGNRHGKRIETVESL